MEKEERMRRQRRQALVQEIDALFRAGLSPLRRGVQHSTSSSSSSQPGKEEEEKEEEEAVQDLLRRSVHPLALGVPVATQRQVPTVHSFMLPVQFLDKVLDMPVVVLRQVLCSMVQKTVESPQLHFIDGRRHSLSFRRSRSAWSRLFSGSLRFRSCRSLFGGRCPCCSGRADSQVPPWRRPRFFFFSAGPDARHHGRCGS